MHPVVRKMYEQDDFSQWLGIEVIASSPGYCKAQMKLRNEMTNGFGIAHGGITYSLADSALAFASNAHGKQAVSIETDISHIETVRVGDTLIAEASEQHLGNKIARYTIRIVNQEEKLVALFNGTVYRSSRDWEV